MVTEALDWFKTGKERKDAWLKRVSFVVTALHYWHLGGVVVFFVENVVYWCWAAAGSAAETIVIRKVQSVSFSLDGLPGKTWKWLNKFYGRNPVKITRISIKCVFNTFPFFFLIFSSPVMVLQAGEDVLHVLNSALRWGHRLLGSRWGSPGARSSRDWKSQ